MTQAESKDVAGWIMATQDSSTPVPMAWEYYPTGKALHKGSFKTQLPWII